jgi:hypothetical protein
VADAPSITLVVRRQGEYHLPAVPCHSTSYLRHHFRPLSGHAYLSLPLRRDSALSSDPPSLFWAGLHKRKVSSARLSSCPVIVVRWASRGHWPLGSFPVTITNTTRPCWSSFLISCVIESRLPPLADRRSFWLHSSPKDYCFAWMRLGWTISRADELFIGGCSHDTSNHVIT